MPAPSDRPFGGRPELGQNFPVDDRVTRRIARSPARPRSGTGGRGRCPHPLVVDVGGPVTAVELDPHRVASLRATLGRRVWVEHADMLRFRLHDAHHVVSNAPFSITTPLLRHLLGQRAWLSAVLLPQWHALPPRWRASGRHHAADGQLVALVRVRAGRAGAVGGVPAAPRGGRRAAGVAAPRRTAGRGAGAGAYQRLVRTAFDDDRVGSALRRAPVAIRRSRRAPVAIRRSRPRDLRAEAWVALHRRR